MASTCESVATPASDRYRSVPESRMVRMLLLVAWSYEAESKSGQKAAQDTLESWVRMGLGFRRAENGERLFDPIEVDHFPKQVSVTTGDNSFPDQLSQVNRRLVTDLARGGSYGERRFVVNFTRTYNLRSIAKGTKLRLRAPLPLAGEYLKDLHVKAFAETSGDSRVDVSPGRLEVRTIADGETDATLGATLIFTCRLQEPSQGFHPTLPDAALYLNNQEGLIVVSERIRALSLSLAKADAPSLEAVRAFWDYIKNELSNGALHYDQMDLASPCDWVLDTGWYDCQMGATLLTALCRARGLPARVLGGYLLHHMAPTKHYWAEVWIEGQGWTPFDFLGVGVSTDSGNREWHDHFFGRLEYRITCERLPRDFTGALGVPLPPTWCLLQEPKSGGVKSLFVDDNGTPVYTDTLRVSG